MRVQLSHPIDDSATVIVGTWDPLLTEHCDLLSATAAQCGLTGSCLAVVLLTPAPPQLLHGAAAWPVCDEPWYRARFIEQSGAACVATVELTEADLGAGADDFLATLGHHLPIGHLLLGAKQSFGTGPHGSQSAILEAAARRGIGVTALPERPLVRSSAAIRTSLQEGRVAPVTALLGRPVTRVAGEQSNLTGWANGPYGVRYESRGGYAAATIEVFDGHADWRECPSGDVVHFLNGPAD